MTEIASTARDGQTACKTCGADLAGIYCAQCGQKHRATRFTLGAVLKDAIAQFLSLDRGFISTVVSLFKNPGKVIEHYVSGKTVLFSNPFRYFLLWITVAQLIALWSGALGDFAEGFVNAGGDEVEASKIVGYLTSYYVLGLAGSFPFFVLATRVFFWGTGRNTAEHTIFHLFLSGQFAFYISISFIGLGLLGDKIAAVLFVLALIAGLAGVTRAAIRFFGVGKLRAIVATPLLIASALFLYISTIMVSLKLILMIL